MDSAVQGGLHLPTCSEQNRRSAHILGPLQPSLSVSAPESKPIGPGRPFVLPYPVIQDFQKTWLEALR
jgi:hypothetical protein